MPSAEIALDEELDPWTRNRPLPKVMRECDNIPGSWAAQLMPSVDVNNGLNAPVATKTPLPNLTTPIVAVVPEVRGVQLVPSGDDKMVPFLPTTTKVWLLQLTL